MAKRPKPSEVAAALHKRLSFQVKGGQIVYKPGWPSRPASIAEEKLWKLATKLMRERMTETEDNACGCPVWGQHDACCRRSFT